LTMMAELGDGNPDRCGQLSNRMLLFWGQNEFYFFVIIFINT
jgi:hypothetical protein